MERHGQNEARFPEQSFLAFGGMQLLLGAFIHVDFAVTEPTPTPPACCTHFRGWAQRKALGSLSVSRVRPLISEPSLNYQKLWRCRNPCLGKGLECVVQGRGFRVELWEELLGIVQKFISLWEFCTSWFWWGNKKTTKVFLETSKIFGRLFYKHFVTYAYLDFVQD